MQRISIVGTSGSGKTTLATNIARQLNVPHTELDALNWEPNWTSVPPEVMRERVAAAVAADSWVIDGGYSFVRDLIWQRADTVIWLDYSLPVILGRLSRRTARRIIWREELWNGNRESLAKTLSRDSILLWALKTYRYRRHRIPATLAAPEYSHLQVLHFRSPRQTKRWLAVHTGTLPTR